MDKLQSALLKARNLNLKAFREGRKNYLNKSIAIELRAHRLSEICASCPFLIDEPIQEAQIADNIKSISKKSCKQCGCVGPYLLRQKVKPCKINKWS